MEKKSFSIVIKKGSVVSKELPTTDGLALSIRELMTSSPLSDGAVADVPAVLSKLPDDATFYLRICTGEKYIPEKVVYTCSLTFAQIKERIAVCKGYHDYERKHPLPSPVETGIRPVKGRGAGNKLEDIDELF